MKGNFEHHSKPAADDKDMIFGVRPVEEAIKAEKEIDRVLVQKDTTNPLVLEVLKDLRKQNVAVQYVPIDKLNRITRKNHQGIIAFLSVISYAQVEDVVASVFDKGEVPFILVLDRITDVRNFGAIARTAECAGVHAIVVPDRGSAQINADAVKTSAGALSHIPVCRVPNLKYTLDYLKDAGLQLVACTEKGADPLYKADLQGPIAVLMGSEEDGVSPEYLKRTDKAVFIPMTGNISSLNVSVATAVIIYEVIRQRSM